MLYMSVVARTPGQERQSMVRAWRVFHSLRRHPCIGAANPLDDIINTRRIAAVILRGAAVDRSRPVP